MNNDLRTDFIAAMGQVACTVNIVSTSGPGGCAGVTVSAMSSVSADGPQPTLLICVHHLSPAARAIAENGVFCVNVLRADQSHISDHFAGRIKAEDKFACAEWTICETGAPRLADPLVAFECRLQLNQRLGTHHVFFGAVQAVHFGKQGRPLLYNAQAYGISTPLAA